MANFKHVGSPALSDETGPMLEDKCVLKCFAEWWPCCAYAADALMEGKGGRCITQS